MNRKNIAIILAGGVGVRMGLGYPKQFSKIAGKTALEHTVNVFQMHNQIDEIIIVSERNNYSKITELMTAAGFNKVSKILYGGKERTDSTLSAIKSLQDESDETNVLIHDAVRPLVSGGIITNCIKKLQYYNAVDVAVPATDTIVHVDVNTKEIKSIPKRSEFYQGQTPQAFRLGTLREAYEIYMSSDMEATCDCGIVLKALPHEKIAIAEGSHTNIKLTRPVDLFIADKLFQSRSNFSLSNLNSIEDLKGISEKVLVVVGGSYGIGAEIIKLAKDLGAKTYSLSRSSGVDVADLVSINQEFRKIVADEGRIDYVVNSAAILLHKPFSMMTSAEIVNSINVNYLGAVNVISAAYPYLKQSRGGLLNFTSSSYTRGRAFYSIYSSTKAAIVNITQALAEEWHSEGIAINCINPERTKTPMREKAFGLEPADTLLDPKAVAIASLAVLVSKETGNVVDVVRKDEEYIAKLLVNPV